MRVTSHCVNHPSKEASQRCHSCRKWLCGACVRRIGRHVYCGRKCQLAGVIKDAVVDGWEFARRPVHAAWAIGVTAASSAILLTAISLHLAELNSVRVSDTANGFEPFERREMTAEILDGESGPMVRIEGRPGGRVLVLEGDRPLQVLTIGANGITDTPLPDGTDTREAIHLVALSGTTVDLDVSAVQVPAPNPAAVTALTPVPPSVAASAPDVAPVTAAGPIPPISPPVLQLVADGGPYIALTFDGNSSSNRTAELLDLLHDLNLRVTLFVTGRFIERYPEIVRRAVLSGDEIGNHTYSHRHLTTYEQNGRHSLRAGVTRELFQDELRRTEQAFKEATGRSMAPLWRAPFGEENQTLRGWALEMGYLHVRWSSLEGASLDSRDWVADEHSSMYQKSSTMMKRLLSFPELRGGIVLMHLATNRDEAPWQELPAFVETLRARGVAPTTVMRLLEASPTWRPWLRRAQARHRETFGR